MSCQMSLIEFSCVGEQDDAATEKHWLLYMDLVKGKFVYF